MKLYVFRPEAFGPMTYSIMAESESNAISAVKSHAEKEIGFKGHDEWGGIDSTEDGEPAYKVECYNPGQVAENNNS